MIGSEASPSLFEKDKQEWWDVIRLAKPQITLEEFEVVWLEFQEAKIARERAKSLN